VPHSRVPHSRVPHSRVPRSRVPHHNNASEQRKSEEGCVMRVIRPAHHRARNEVGAATGDFSHTQQIFSTEPYLILSRILYSVLKDFEAPPSLCEYILVTTTTTRRRELSGNSRDERLAKFLFFAFQKNQIWSMASKPSPPNLNKYVSPPPPPRGDYGAGNRRAHFYKRPPTIQFGIFFC